MGEREDRDADRGYKPSSRDRERSPGASTTDRPSRIPQKFEDFPAHPPPPPPKVDDAADAAAAAAALINASFTKKSPVIDDADPNRKITSYEQDGLHIRDIEINDVKNRYLLTKAVTQNEV